jgi:SAM-dependent methyltransferase
MPAAPRPAEAVLAGAMWWYAASVLHPLHALRRAGLRMGGRIEGDEPVGLPRPGLGPFFSRRHAEPVLLDDPSPHDHLVEEFDRLAEVYGAAVKPFSGPIFDEALEVIARYVAPRSRILDAGCGPGRELRLTAGLVPDGEVVGVDLAAGMVEAAHRAARAEGLDNCAFFQADAGDLPRAFTSKFDLVYNCLAHHHYPEPAAAASSALRCLRKHGVYCVVDFGREWLNKLSSPIARWADPGWIGFHSPDEFRALFRQAGFARTAWIDLLGGFGVAVGQKR